MRHCEISQNRNGIRRIRSSDCVPALIGHRCGRGHAERIPFRSRPEARARAHHPDGEIGITAGFRNISDHPF